MPRLLLALCVVLAACGGVTETNVSPAPCERDEDCGPGALCAPLDDAAEDDGGVPRFCRAR